MRYITTIDTVSIQIDNKIQTNRDELLNNLLSLLEADSYYIQRIDNYTDTHSIFYMQEYRVIVEKKIILCIRTGSHFASNANSNYVNYYLKLTFAGLVSYNEKNDNEAKNILSKVCSFLNFNNITFKITSLDIALDIFTRFNNVLVLCTKKISKIDYYSANEEQKYSTTKYIEKIGKHRFNKISQRAYCYDKTKKEGLSFNVTRFEVKLTSSFFTRSRENMFIKIKKALERYHVMYIPTMKLKKFLIEEYDSRAIVRSNDIKKLEFDKYRCYHNMYAIVDFMNNLRCIQETNSNSIANDLVPLPLGEVKS